MDLEKWEAIIHNDASYDGKFYYGVTTTRIFCRPSCKSKNPNIEHVRIFQSASEAAAEQFRPCKRCKPEGGKYGPEEAWVEQIKEFIAAHYRGPLTLTILAEMLHASPYHMHRTFKKIEGVTPAEYILRLRIGEAKRLLTKTNLTVMDIALNVGFTNAAHFSTVFHKKTGFSPSDYRQASYIHREEGDRDDRARDVLE